jgi:hypothetical protein
MELGCVDGCRLGRALGWLVGDWLGIDCEKMI